MEITKEQAMTLSHISDSEIKQDLADTECEAKDFEDELEVLRRNSVDNKVRIYMVEGHLLNRKTLINKLNTILKYRAE